MTEQSIVPTVSVGTNLLDAPASSSVDTTQELEGSLLTLEHGNDRYTTGSRIKYTVPRILGKEQQKSSRRQFGRLWEISVFPLIKRIKDDPGNPLPELHSSAIESRKSQLAITFDCLIHGIWREIQFSRPRNRTIMQRNLCKQIFVS